MECYNVGMNRDPDMKKYVNLGIGYQFEKDDFCGLEGASEGLNCGDNDEFTFGEDTNTKCTCSGPCPAGQCFYKTCKRFRYSGDPNVCCNLDAEKDSYYEDNNGKVRTCDPKYYFNNRDQGQCDPYHKKQSDIPSLKTSGLNPQGITPIKNPEPMLVEYDKTNMEYCKDDQYFFDETGFCDEWISQSMLGSDRDRYDADNVINTVCSRPQNINKLKCGCVLAEKEKIKFSVDLQKESWATIDYFKRVFSQKYDNKFKYKYVEDKNDRCKFL